MGQEFALTIFATPDGYADRWTQASDEKKWSAKFTIIVPKGFEIVDDDFSEGRPYYGIHGMLLDDYLFYSAVRDVGFPPQTTVHIKPTEPGIWQINASHDTFVPGKIFVTLTENYSYVSDKPHNAVQKDTCGKDLDGRGDGIAMFDVESNSIIKNTKNNFMAKNSYNDWKIITNPVTNLIYVYEYYTPTIPVIHENSGETEENLKLTTSSEIRISDIAINPETNLIYLADNGRVGWRAHSEIIVLDGDDHSIVSTIGYPDGTAGNDSISSIAVNPKTNTLYAMTNEDNLYVFDLDTEEVIAMLYLEPDGRSGGYDVEVNSATNKIYALNDALYVIDGHENSVEKIMPVDPGTIMVQVNERDNEIYLLGYSAQLLIIDGSDHRTSTIYLQRSGFDMDFDPVHGNLYVPNRDGSVTVVDTSNLEFDIMDDCSYISNISINPKTGILSAVDEVQPIIVNVIEPTGPSQIDRVWVEDSEYPRTEYLPDEQISFKISNTGNADIEVDSVRIQNTNTGSVAVAFTKPQTIKQNSFIDLAWDQTDSNGRQVPPDRYAVILKGHDGKSVLYEAHNLFSIIDKDRLAHLESLHKDTFSYLKSNGDNSGDAALPDAPNGSTPPDTADDSAPQKSQPDAFSADAMCKNNPVLVTRNYERFACVKFTTSEKLVPRGWDVVSTKSDARAPVVTQDDTRTLPRDVMHDFPLSGGFTANDYARFNVEFSQRPVLGEEFDIAIRYKILDDGFSSKKSEKAIPFTLTLSDGVEYVGGDMRETGRKYSLATGQYNTMYGTENLSTDPDVYESTSTLKFPKSGEHYFGVQVSGQFDTFWFFVGDDGTVHMKEDIVYDNRVLYQLMLILGAYHPESIGDELEAVFDGDAKRVLEEYYQSHEYQRPIAPVDMLTTKVQLQDIACRNGIFYKFTPGDSVTSGGMHCGSESTLEYYADQSRPFEAYERDEAIRLLTVNTDSSPMSGKSIFYDTLENALNDEWFPSRLLTHKDKVTLPPPYHYLGEPCSNDALYATFEVPRQVPVGGAFDIVLTYSWKVPNPNWDVMSGDDRGTMQNLRDKYLPPAESVNGDRAALTGVKLGDPDNLDMILDQMVEILNKYGLDDSNSNLYGYQVVEYYPECDAPILSVEFPEELKMLSDGFEITGSPDKHKVAHQHGKQTISFGNDHPHTSIITMSVNEPTFHLVNLLRIGIAGHGGFFAFSVTNDTATFNHNYPDSLERLRFIPQIDKFGNILPLHEQDDTPYYLDNVLSWPHRPNSMSVEDARQLQLEFLKHQVLNPDHDFTTFYKIFSGTDFQAK